MITYHYLTTYLTPVCQSKEVLNNDGIGIGVWSRNSVSRSEAASELIDSTRASVLVRNEPHQTRVADSELGFVCQIRQLANILEQI